MFPLPRPLFSPTAHPGLHGSQSSSVLLHVGLRSQHPWPWALCSDVCFSLFPELAHVFLILGLPPLLPGSLSCFWAKGTAWHFHHRSSHCMGLAVCFLVDEEHLINAMLLNFVIALSIPVVLKG